VIITNKTENLENVDFPLGHIVLINKEKDWTSFDIVNKIRFMITKKLGIKSKKLKVGHGGTLDPLATGVVVIGIGKETKNLQNYQNEQKEYIAEVHFGYTTASYDAETELEGNYATEHINAESITKCLQENFSGEINQMPPMFSAKSVNGVRAYTAARKGEVVELKASRISIYEIELLSFKENKASIRVVCSKGTYIRSLAYDLGKALNSGAYLSNLIRTKSGGFAVENCLSVSEFETLLNIE